MTLSDDIIYDPLPPNFTITQIRGGTVTLAIFATDQQNGSGVGDMQISKNSTFLGSVSQPFAPTAQIIAEPGISLYVRVRYRVGNIAPV